MTFEHLIIPFGPLHVTAVPFEMIKSFVFSKHVFIVSFTFILFIIIIPIPNYGLCTNINIPIRSRKILTRFVTAFLTCTSEQKYTLGTYALC